MQVAEFICVAALFALGMFLTVGGYILQRDRYWRRIWMRLGEPDVRSIEELRALSKAQTNLDSEYTKPDQTDPEQAKVLLNS